MKAYGFYKAVEQRLEEEKLMGICFHKEYVASSTVHDEQVVLGGTFDPHSLTQLFTMAVQAAWSATANGETVLDVHEVHPAVTRR